MSDINTGQMMGLALGGVAVVMVFAGPVLIGRIFGSGKSSKSAELIPAAETYFLSCGESMTVVRQVLTRESFLGCRYRITYDRMDEGRIQARLYGVPKFSGGADQGEVKAVDVLLNMLFHRLESDKTEVEWSYVVMSSRSPAAFSVVEACNKAFRDGLKSAQSARQSTAEQLLSEEDGKEAVATEKAKADEPEKSA
ncbi:MAG: hypothetical protein SFV17_23870 [Candidatus Obscuribacter sp.]|nr:hypothetical protein [Candidatus Melainabacteria bacterium]MDX1989749.1 hypothetical protein [Candidatus Obscuribacter sp.]